MSTLGWRPYAPLKRSPADIISHVLNNGRVQSAFTHQSLAEQILACFSALRIEITTAAERELRRLMPPARYVSST
jgi:hypothetical protein